MTKNLFPKLFRYVSLLFFLQASLQLFSQEFSVMGLVKDKQSDIELQGATVALIQKNDTTLRIGTAVDFNGSFTLSVQASTYLLKINYVGYVAYQRELTISAALDLGTIYLLPDELTLKEVKVEAEQIKILIKGDTIEYNADAFKVHEDASAEDLVKKLPGVTIEGNVIKVNGEVVEKILVDGKPFFSNDPSGTLQNLPADVLKSVQVYDKQSKQSELTGFKDGKEQRTIDLITKPDANKGSFGKAYAGYGLEDRYTSGFTLNNFNGDRRISILGLSNNINQQNFNFKDIQSIRSNADGAGGGMRYDAFWSGNQQGIAKTNAFGINYVDTWGDRIEVSGNYYVNNTRVQNNSSSVRNYYTADKLVYNEANNSNSNRTHHNFAFDFTFEIDSMNTLYVIPMLRVSGQNSASDLIGSTQSSLMSLINSLSINSKSQSMDVRFENEILWEHNFRKEGRTFSIDLMSEHSNNSGDGAYQSINQSNDSLFFTTARDQKFDNTNRISSLEAIVSYTEPLGENGQMMVTYEPTFSRTVSDRQVWNNMENAILLPDTSLFNRFNSSYEAHIGGLDYQFESDNAYFDIGLDIQQATLKGEQTFPDALNTSRNFFNVLPRISFNYKQSSKSNIIIGLYSYTQHPSIQQMQNSINVQDPLFVRIGNPEIKQTTRNDLYITVTRRFTEKEQNISFFVNAYRYSDMIGNSTTILTADTMVQNVLISRGSQLIMPVNLDKNFSWSSNLHYSFPVKFIKSNLSFYVNYDYKNIPVIINDKLNYAKNNRYLTGMRIGSNISKTIDFSLGYSASFSDVKNDLEEQIDNQFVTQTITGNINWILKDRIVFATNINQYFLNGLNSQFAQEYTLWNASLGYKMLKNRALELKLSGFDLLNKNNYLNRSFNESYYEDKRTQMLNRYFLMTLIYTVKMKKPETKSLD